MFKWLVWLDTEKSHCQRDSNSGSSALEVDALTTRPVRRYPTVIQWSKKKKKKKKLHENEKRSWGPWLFCDPEWMLLKLLLMSMHVSLNRRDCLVGLVVKANASRAKDPGFESCLGRDFSGVGSYQWLKNWHSSGYPARRRHYRVSAGTGWTGVSILWLGERGKVCSATTISVWQHVKLSEQIRPWDTLVCC